MLVTASCLCALNGLCSIIVCNSKLSVVGLHRLSVSSQCAIIRVTANQCWSTAAVPCPCEVGGNVFCCPAIAAREQHTFPDSHSFQIVQQPLGTLWPLVQHTDPSKFGCCSNRIFVAPACSTHSINKCLHSSSVFFSPISFSQVLSSSPASSSISPAA